MHKSKERAAQPSCRETSDCREPQASLQDTAPRLQHTDTHTAATSEGVRAALYTHRYDSIPQIRKAGQKQEAPRSLLLLPLQTPAHKHT
jgi:hypothetical protein